MENKMTHIELQNLIIESIKEVLKEEEPNVPATTQTGLAKTDSPGEKIGKGIAKAGGKTVKVIGNIASESGKAISTIADEIKDSDAYKKFLESVAKEYKTGENTQKTINGLSSVLNEVISLIKKGSASAALKKLINAATLLAGINFIWTAAVNSVGKILGVAQHIPFIGKDILQGIKSLEGAATLTDLQTATSIFIAIAALNVVKRLLNLGLNIIPNIFSWATGFMKGKKQDKQDKEDTVDVDYKDVTNIKKRQAASDKIDRAAAKIAKDNERFKRPVNEASDESLVPSDAADALVAFVKDTEKTNEDKLREFIRNSISELK